MDAGSCSLELSIRDDSAVVEAGFDRLRSANRMRHSRAANRVRMIWALARLIPRRDRLSRALARAVLTTALGGIPPDELAWITRIEAHRDELASRAAGMPSLYQPRNGEGLTPARDQRDSAPDIALISVTSQWGVFLMRLVRELAPRQCVELGTGFGISTAYQAAALELNRAGRLTSLDAAPECIRTAKIGLSALGLDHRVELELGVIGETLPTVLERTGPVDYVFVDAEHQGTVTLQYFEAMLPCMSPGAVAAFDDIGFTADMLAAWNSIRRDERIAQAFGLGRVALAITAREGNDRAC